MMRMPPVAPLPPKNNRPNEHRQGNQEKRAGINDNLGDGGPGGNQRPDRILFADTKRTGQKTGSHRHGTISIFRATFILSLVRLLFQRNRHQDKASRVIFNSS